MITKFKKNLKLILPILFSILASFFCGLCQTQTLDYKLDHFSYEICNYNKYFYNDTFINPLLQISKSQNSSFDKSDLFTPLLRYFYYNSLVADVRQPLLNDTFCYGDSIKLFTQDTFSIATTELNSGGYYLDYGLFACYYSPSFLGTNNYLQARFSCDSFIFLSDSFANYLLDKYDIDSYETLMTDERYAILSITDLNGNELSKCSINNIVYSTLRSAPKTFNLYGNFGVIYNNANIKRWSNVGFELGLKVDPYGTKNVLKSINNLGYGINDIDFNFVSYDYTNNSYFDNHYLSLKYPSLWSNNQDVMYYFFSCSIIFLSCLGLVIYFLKIKMKIKESTISFLISIFAFIVFSIIVTFTYNYPFFSILPILLVLIYIYFFVKTYNVSKKKYIIKPLVDDSVNIYDEINI